MGIRRLSQFGVCLLAVLLSARLSLAQEKKNVRMVFVSLAWNSEIPFRVALARGFFKQQGLSVEPISDSRRAGGDRRSGFRRS